MIIGWLFYYTRCKILAIYVYISTVYMNLCIILSTMYTFQMIFVQINGDFCPWIWKEKHKVLSIPALHEFSKINVYCNRIILHIIQKWMYTTRVSYYTFPEMNLHYNSIILHNPPKRMSTVMVSYYTFPAINIHCNSIILHIIRNEYVVGLFSKMGSQDQNKGAPPSPNFHMAIFTFYNIITYWLCEVIYAFELV